MLGEAATRVEVIRKPNEGKAAALQVLEQRRKGRGEGRGRGQRQTECAAHLVHRVDHTGRGTGLLRAFAGLEKGSAYYLANSTFHLKIGLFLLILALEIFSSAS